MDCQDVVYVSISQSAELSVQGEHSEVKLGGPGVEGSQRAGIPPVLV